MRPLPLIVEFGSPSRAKRTRTVALSRRALFGGAALAAMLLTWSGGSLWYFVSRDQVALKLLERQATIKRSYEDKLAALRTRFDEVASQRLVEQEILHGKVETLLTRQAAFESRQAAVLSLAERAVQPAPAPAREAKPEPGRDLPAGVSAYAPVAKPALPEPFELRLGGPGGWQKRSDLDGLKGRLDSVEASLSGLESIQNDALQSLTATAESTGQRIEAAIRKVGLDPNAAEQAGGTGGPLVAVPEGALDPLIGRAEQSLARLAGLRRAAASLPFAEPIPGDADLSSGFGYRIDPFTRAPAMHTGLDFKAEAGAVVRASGRGRVVVAEWSGAYGNMVEVEHAQGVTSRYAHLSAIGVAVGQEVRPGAVLGRVGSTGRSTGAHLHFETRVNGEAVDPLRFMRAGAGLAPIVTASR